MNSLLTPCRANVQLISMTEDAERIMYSAAKGCVYGDIQPYLIQEDRASIGNFLIEKYYAGHRSIFEFGTLIFRIEHLSRVATHQLVRYRLASYLQLSQRWTDALSARTETINGVVMPNSFKKVPEHILGDVDETLKRLASLYEILQQNGVPAEDARYILPHGWETAITVQYNIHEFMHICNQRLCSHAQWEIRDVVAKMLDLVRKDLPTIGFLIDNYCFKECVNKCKKGAMKAHG